MSASAVTSIFTQRCTLQDLLADPSWDIAVFPRWSDPTGREDAEDVARETLDRLPAGHAAIGPAKDLCVRILRNPDDSTLSAAGVVPIYLQDINTLAARGATGRTPIAWSFIVEDVLVVLTMHGAFEDNVFGAGAALDQGLNAYTELCLQVYRSRPAGATSVYAFDTRVGRTGANRSQVFKAARVFRWKVLVKGEQVNLNEHVMGAVRTGMTQTQSEEFLSQTMKGELDDLEAGLYPKSEQGLPFYHRFATRTVSDPVSGRTYDELISGQVVPRVEVVDGVVTGGADVLRAVQDLLRRIADGESWKSLQPYAGTTYGIRSRHAEHLKMPVELRPTVDKLKTAGHALKGHFTPDHVHLLRTGYWRRKHHGKIQADVEYGTHGKAATYTPAELNAMTDRQKAKALKGYFEVSVFWGVPMLPGPDGVPVPWGVDEQTFARVEERLTKEAGSNAPTGAAAHLRDKKPLAGLSCWHDDEHCFVLAAKRTEAYELWQRPVRCCVNTRGRRNGWTGTAAGARVIGVRADRLHVDIGMKLSDVLADLADGAARLSLPELRRVQEETRAQRARRLLQADIDQLIADVEDKRTRATGACNLAQLLAAMDPEAGLKQYQAAAQLEAQAAALDLEVAAKRTELEAVGDGDPERNDAMLDFSQPSAVAAALLAYTDQAPPELNAAVLLLVRDTLRISASDDRLSVRWKATVHLPLDNGETGTYELSGVSGSRWRADSKAPGSWTTYVDTARRYLAAPAKPDGTAVTFEEVAAEVGWAPAEVERKVWAFLGSARGLPKGTACPKPIPSRWMRAALVKCPVAAVRHALWAHLMPAEASVASYLLPDYRRHIIDTYMDPAASWLNVWAADTHLYRRRLFTLCLQQCDISAGVRVDDAARRLGVREADILDWTRPYKVGRTNAAPAYAPTVEKAIAWGRGSDVAADDRRVRPVACPHADCPGRRTGGTWCTLVLRVPELSGWSVLCPACMRVPDLKLNRLVFPPAYALPWEGPAGFRSKIDGVVRTGTVVGDSAAYMVA